MSKMSQLHAELSEQAYELGFESLDEAAQAGYGLDWEKHKLLSPEELAHKAWVEERDLIIKRLRVISTRSKYDRDTVEMAIDFIKKGEV